METALPTPPALGGSGLGHKSENGRQVRLGVGVGVVGDTGSDTGHPPSQEAFGLPTLEAEVWGTPGPPASGLSFLSPRTAGSRCPSRRMTTAASPWMATCCAGSATPPEPRAKRGRASPFPISGPPTRRPPSPPFSYFFDVRPLLRQPPARDPKCPVRGSSTA